MSRQFDEIFYFLNFFFSSGKHKDLSKINGLKNIIIESFNHNSEEVKSAASYALGNISLGNLGDYVPFVLKEIQAQPKRQYLLLHSLKEIISAQSGSARSVQVLAPFVPAIWRQLFNHCECNEEGKKLNKTHFRLENLKKRPMTFRKIRSTSVLA